MVVRNRPPGRKSISQSIVFQGMGQNQGMSSAGSVQARHTCALGTLTTRVKLRSSFALGWYVGCMVCLLLRAGLLPSVNGL